VIIVHCRPLPETRTQNSACAWLAECEIDGRQFEAKSRHGAPNALARELVAAGIPDQPISIHYEGLAGAVRYRSFHAAAAWTFAESQSTPLRRVPYREFGEPSEGAETLHRPPEQMRFSVGHGSLEGPAENTPFSAQPDEGSKSTPIPGGARPRCVTCGQEFQPRRPWATFCSARCRVAAHRRRKLDGIGDIPTAEAA
jgi:hypothetical protein